MFNVNKLVMDSCGEILCKFGWETVLLPKGFTHPHSGCKAHQLNLHQHSHLGLWRLKEVIQDSMANWYPLGVSRMGHARRDSLNHIALWCDPRCVCLLYFEGPSEFPSLVLLQF